MKHCKILYLFLVFLTFSCTKEQQLDPLAEKNDVIQSVTAGWTIDGYTNVDNLPIDQKLFSGGAEYIDQFIYTFNKDGIVRAFDKQSKQAGTYGTWKLVDNAKNLDINIPGFKGLFAVIELTKQKMIIRNSVKYKGVETPINMVFIPLK